MGTTEAWCGEAWVLLGLFRGIWVRSYLQEQRPCVTKVHPSRVDTSHSWKPDTHCTQINGLRVSLQLVFESSRQLVLTSSSHPLLPLDLCESGSQQCLFNVFLRRRFWTSWSYHELFICVLRCLPVVLHSSLEHPVVLHFWKALVLESFPPWCKVLISEEATTEHCPYFH